MLLPLCINIAAVLHVNVTAAVYGWCHCHVQVVPLLQVNVSVMCMSIIIICNAVATVRKYGCNC